MSKNSWVALHSARFVSTRPGVIPVTNLGPSNSTAYFCSKIMSAAR